MRSRTTPAGLREHIGAHAWVRLPDLPGVPDLPAVDGRPERPDLPDARAPSGAR